MYVDYILFAAGGVLVLLAAVLAVILLVSRKRSREYQRVLREETTQINVVETLRRTQTGQTGPQEQAEGTERTGQADVEEATELTSLDEQTELTAWDDMTAAINIAERTGETPEEMRIGRGLDLSPLAGRYELLREIHGGGMSRVFLAKHLKLGNEWIVKYVDGSHAELANEAEVLKKLNHISLPQIIDIFEGRQGTFLVERYIEGYPLDQVLKLEQYQTEGMIIDWGVQLAQVLHYLHNLETPIIHCDLKPSNIMVTHDNRLMLIDFGISKGVTEKSIGLTYRYAAPEQFQGAAASGKAAQARFGKLPQEHTEWQIDARTDLYSVGVILYELAMKDIPTEGNLAKISGQVTPELASVIRKCLELEPDKRYQSAKELTEALEKLKTKRLTMARSLVKRRVMTACCAVFLLAGLGVSASGAYINQVETKAVVTIEPDGEVVVTEQQGVTLQIRKTTAGGRTTLLEPSQMEWSYENADIARIDGNRLVGLNIGQTTLHGSYRNKDVSLHITVVRPVKQKVSTLLEYVDNTEISVYAGNGERDFVDDVLESCSLVSPEKITVDGDSFYFADSGMLRVLEDGEVYTVPLEPEYLTTQIVRSLGPAFYILTGPWEAEDEESYYGFLEITDDGAGFIYYTEAAWSVITDFNFSSDGLLWFIQQNLGTGMTTLNTLDTETLEQQWVMDLPDSAHSLVFDEDDNLYISVQEEGTIIRIGKGETEWRYFAGVNGMLNFIDGEVANFYRPTSLAVEEDSLYVLDFDTVRRVQIDGDAAGLTETLVGVPVADTNPPVTLGEGFNSVLPASELASIAMNESGQLLLTDPKNSLIYEIQRGK